MKKLIFLFLTTTIGISSCDKKSDPAPTKEQLLTIAKGWVRTDYTVTSKAGNLVEEFADLEPCEVDNVFLFTSDGKSKVVEGATSCDPPANFSETWSFNADKSKLTWFDVDWDLKELSASVLKISRVDATTDPTDEEFGEVTVLVFAPVK